MDNTVIDKLFSEHVLTCQVQPIIVAPDDLAHVVGAQEPMRNQPDDRAQMLLTAGWLKVESVRIDLPESDRSDRVATVQRAARAWLKQSSPDGNPADREQVRWMVEKTRSYESKQQIAQRVWLALILYSLGHRGLRFDSEGQIHWDSGSTGRLGLSPDATLDLAWQQRDSQVYVSSFRQPDGTITRGKGRHRWNVYRLTVDRAAAPLFEHRAKKVSETVALIVASETHATQPQLPRDFYGGDAFQQACIDAQDQQYDHILVLSPKHGVISLDDMVPVEQSWDEVIERRIWAWQILAMQRLGVYLLGESRLNALRTEDINGWAWLNPESSYTITVFGGGFVVRILLDQLVQSRARAPQQWPEIILAEYRPGYHVGDYDDDFSFEFDEDEDDDEVLEDYDFEDALQDIDQLLEWATELSELVNVFVPPTSEVWDLAPDEALIPVRLLTEMGMEIEDLLDLLTDVNLLLEQSIPISILINAPMVVSVLLQVAHTLAHNERDPIPEMLRVFPEDAVRQYIEGAIQEATLEDRLCACLTLAEQIHLLAMAVPPSTSDQLLVWLQTYISTRLRQRLLGDADEPAQRT